MTGAETQLLLARAVLLILLYSFLAAVALLAWLDLGRAKSRALAPSVPASAGPRLIVLDGAGSDRAPGTALVLEPVTAVGRDLDNGIVLIDPTVSARHAVVVRRDGAWWLEDLGSTNGTFLNGERLPAQAPNLLRSGDVLQFGGVRLRLINPETS